jgi:flagellar hook-length control protein FliK
MTQQTGQTADMQSIISQITDYMKVQLKPDMTSMELQLHPQSLGNVNVIVTAGKDGGVVAQFTAQNETVKAALESQVAQLQQRFDEQGIKIDAVEVTVQSHQFEQNFQQNAQQQAEAQNAGKGSTRTVHRINLGEMNQESEGLEDLDDDSRLTAQMMAVNGNTVDYTA